MTDRPLVIVESPAKTRTLSYILGPKYKVRASMGHIRDLPKKQFGVDIKGGFVPKYRITRYKTVKILRWISERAYPVFIATDPDREGEAIAFHLAYVLNLSAPKLKRITFNELTKQAVLEALNSPRQIDLNLFDAQQARRILDRIVGYKLSPLLRQKLSTKNVVSAGRVQSVALRLIVEREQEIEKFVPQEYWEIFAKLAKKTQRDKPFQAKLEKIDGKKPEIKSKQEADAIISDLKGRNFIVSKIRQREVEERPPPPFNTGLLQQQAFSKLGYPASKTMQIAQQLYEGVFVGEKGYTGLITYVRTDSFRVSSSALREVRNFINRKYGDKYLPQKPNYFKSPKIAQEAHEAVRPTYIFYEPEKIKDYLTSDQFKLYKLIFDRFVASQMSPARYSVKEVEIIADRALFLAKEKSLIFDGYLRAMPHIPPTKHQIPDTLTEGEHLLCLELSPVQNFTTPPARYTQASLIKTLEKLGIGRPSTYVPIITILKKRRFIIEEKKKLYPTELGKLVVKKLTKHFETLMDVKFTSKMEEKLDLVEMGKISRLDLLYKFYHEFESDFKKAQKEMTKEESNRLSGRVFCPSCSGVLVKITVHKTPNQVRCLSCRKKFHCL